MAMKIFSFLSLVFLACACSKQQLNPRDYMKWYSNSNSPVWYHKEIDNYKFSLQYRTPEFIYLLEKNGQFKKDEFDQRKKELGNMQYYLLQISGKSENELMAEEAQGNDYFYRLEYFSGAMQDDVALIEGTDTLPCLLYHYERNYGLSPNNNFVLAFEKSKDSLFATSDKTFLFNDKALGVGPVSLSIKSDDLKTIPVLKD